MIAPKAAFAKLLFPEFLQVAAKPALGLIDEINAIGNPLDRPSTNPGYIPIGRPLYIRGWALADDGAALAGAILIQIDSDEPSPASYGMPREDVAGFIGRESLANCGFEVTLPTHRLAPGIHQITIIVVAVDSRSYSSIQKTWEFHVVDTRLRLAVLMPPANDVLIHLDEIRIGNQALTPSDGRAFLISRNESVHIRGWAFDQEASRVCSACFVVIDEWQYFAITYGVARSDVAESCGLDALVYCGFESEISLTNIALGEHHLSVVALSADGARLSSLATFVTFTAT